MEWLGGWLMSLLVTAAVCMLLELLCISDSLRSSIRLAGGIILALIAVSPLLDADMEWIPSVSAQYAQDERDVYENARKSTDAFITGIVNSHSGYEGASITVLYGTNEDGLPVPQAITIRKSAGGNAQDLKNSLEDANGLQKERIKDALVRIYGMSEDRIQIE